MSGKSSAKVSNADPGVLVGVTADGAKGTVTARKAGGLRDMIPAIARTGGLTRRRDEGCSGGEGQDWPATCCQLACSFPQRIGAVPPTAITLLLRLSHSPTCSCGVRRGWSLHGGMCARVEPQQPANLPMTRAACLLACLLERLKAAHRARGAGGHAAQVRFFAHSMHH